jgi:hypothetical protein
MSEPDIPYPKKPRPEETAYVPYPPSIPPAPTQPPPPSPIEAQTVTKFPCQHCGKIFTTKEELTLHVETAH